MNICTIQLILSIFCLTEVITDFRTSYLALLKPEPPELNLLLEVVDCHYYFQHVVFLLNYDFIGETNTTTGLTKRYAKKPDL